VRITELHIKNFRCFGTLDLSFDNPMVLIEGTDNFFIKVRLAAEDEYSLQVGFSNKKKLVKVNERVISSFKELLDYYRIVTLTEDDLTLIKEGPEGRRFFLDQALMLANPETVGPLKRNRDIVENRNALLKRGGSAQSYELWSSQLWESSTIVQKARIAALTTLQIAVNQLIERYFAHEFSIVLSYTPKKQLHGTYQEFSDKNPTLHDDELRFSRSLFGAHLDDFSIHFKDIKSKNFASRGQQKLIVLLLKIAQIEALVAQKGPAILLLDDFMTDFDITRATMLLTILQGMNIQLIFTIPTTQGFFYNHLLLQGAQLVKLPS
jgi:DNA replication and repair protein RecF